MLRRSAALQGGTSSLASHQNPPLRRPTLKRQLLSTLPVP